MRLWSLDPKYLDARGLVALWRETLLAQKVLSGRTKGYTKHPQLERFKKSKNPLDAIGYYLFHVWKEGKRRGYRFNIQKILKPNRKVAKITVTTGQIAFETRHLNKKLKNRADTDIEVMPKHTRTHPLFRVIKGGKADWER